MARALIAIALCLGATSATAASRWPCDGVAPRHVAACQEYAARYITYREVVEQRKREYADRKKMREDARAKRRESDKTNKSVNSEKVN
ncbi:MAG: hypothetical protein H0T80_01370 [Betaproteobacteria bacterium]|nr:hypothetical protein [Betaproteobacteria bacterium]MBA3777291.1 hypothetical protein [Betaproteobacteria bacterium]